MIEAITFWDFLNNNWASICSLIRSIVEVIAFAFVMYMFFRNN